MGADFGYLCAADWAPAFANNGNHGTLNFSVYDQPNCAGNRLGLFVLFSEGHSGGNATFFIKNVQHLNGLYQSLLLALAHGLKVNVTWETYGSYYKQVRYFSVYAG